MSIAGYNFYLMPSEVKLNDVLSTSPTFTPQGLASDTEYDIRATAVDAAGNEGPMSAPIDPLPRTLQVAEEPGGEITAEQAAAIDAIVAESMAVDTQPGVILDITGPAGNYRKTYGNTAASGGRPVTFDDHFRMGSITKSFTARAALMQIDQGNLSLDDKVTDYVPDVPSTWNNITIEHLMSMQSGIPEYTADFLFQIGVFFFPTNPIARSRILGIIKASNPKFEPGTAFEYSNSNAIMTGEVLQVITGRDIRNILLEDIIQPLGLTETTWPTSAVIPEPAMSGSQWTPDWSREAGCLTTTINDLTKWAKELRDGTLLSPESHFLYTQTFWGMDIGGTDPPTTLGYGHFSMKWGRLVGHGGSHPGGFDSSCLFDPDTGATYTIANNAQIARAPGFYVTTKAISKLLYPGSMANPVYKPPPKAVVLNGIASPRAFGPMGVFRWAPAGDEDGATQIPHKVSYTL